MTETLSPVLGEATIQELRSAVRGAVFTRGDDGYEEACRIWNGTFDGRRPALVVRCAGAADVAARSASAAATASRWQCAAAGTRSPASRPATTGS
jgi:hypothetical protein